jgi:hypothetical protein
METAISIDKQINEKADPDLITEKLNEFYKDHESKLDDDLKYAAYRILNREEW